MEMVSCHWQFNANDEINGSAWSGDINHNAIEVNNEMFHVFKKKNAFSDCNRYMYDYRNHP